MVQLNYLYSKLCMFNKTDVYLNIFKIEINKNICFAWHFFNYCLTIPDLDKIPLSISYTFCLIEYIFIFTKNIMYFA